LRLEKASQKPVPTRTELVARLLIAVPVSEAYSDVGRPDSPGKLRETGSNTRERRDNLLAVPFIGIWSMSSRVALMRTESQYRNTSLGA